MSTGSEHYQEAEMLEASACQPGLEHQWVMARLARAQVHATLALAAVIAESSTSTEFHAQGHPLVKRPTAADDWEGGDPAYPGTPWGRALYGERVSA